MRTKEAETESNPTRQKEFYRTFAAICVYTVALISTVAVWILSWIAGVVMLIVWLAAFAYSAYCLSEEADSVPDGWKSANASGKPKSGEATGKQETNWR